MGRKSAAPESVFKNFVISRLPYIFNLIPDYAINTPLLKKAQRKLSTAEDNSLKKLEGLQNRVCRSDLEHS